MGDQDLCFLSVDKDPYRMILFAGENGVGKSTVVDIIHDFSLPHFYFVNRISSIAIRQSLY